MFVDLFDSVGTLLACSYEAGMVEKDGTIRKIDRMLGADAIATLFGSLAGTSTTTTYIESAAGGHFRTIHPVMWGIAFLSALNLWVTLAAF